MPIASKKDATKRDGSLKAGYTMKTTDAGRIMYFVDPKKAKQLKEKEAKKMAAAGAPVEPKKSVKPKSVKPKVKVVKSSKEVTKSDSIESTVDSQLEDELE